ncbi:MAG: hypothetical protein HKP41_05265 [Desulfobacterales bacterium]|nr:hypothetical protein [Deltaproteobacteria bacterium]NNK93742.1 hypothetical protein [Desulfobacterales bacterium]
MEYLLTSEPVSDSHLDKLVDRISDTVLDRFLKRYPEAKFACETFIVKYLVIIGDES